MQSHSSDPFDVIAVEPPRFAVADAIAIATRQYGLEVTARGLVSERDCNFHLRATDGREFVLKIASSAEDPAVTDFQIQALRYIEGRQADVATPRVVPTLDGKYSFELSSDAGSHVTRLVTWLPGVLLTGQPLVPALCRSFGQYGARLARALEGFDHPGSDQRLVWNMNDVGRVRELAVKIPGEGLREHVVACFERFDAEVRPRFPSLRSQVIHNDLNPENVLLDPRDPTRVVGVIDFGDMVRGPLVADVAIAASYMRGFDGDPLSRIAMFVSAWHEITPLERSEIDLVFDLVLVRLATTVTVLHWRIDARGADDPYLSNSLGAESTAGKFLRILTEVPREHARTALRQACASSDAAAGRPTRAL